MKIWTFDENRADFVEASPERMNADPTGCYIIRRGDDVFVREHGQERPMPERLTVAGVSFDGEQFATVIRNETTIAAMCEARAGNLKTFDSVGALMEDLHAGEL